MCPEPWIFKFADWFFPILLVYAVVIVSVIFGITVKDEIMEWRRRAKN